MTSATGTTMRPTWRDGRQERRTGADGRRAGERRRSRAKVQPPFASRTHQIDHLLNLISEVVIAQIKDEQRSLELRQALE